MDSLEFQAQARALRNAHKLSPIQAGLALGISPITVVAMEGSGPRTRSLQELKEAYSSFASQYPENYGHNLLFGTYDLRLGRELLGLTVEQMATRYGTYSRSSWTKFEANARILPANILGKIELDVRKRMRVVISQATTA
ncbi:MAG TPA: hypothetical protein VJA87_01095 [Candidatus Paceibacterota bacterium]